MLRQYLNIKDTAFAYSDYLVISENYASLYDSPMQRPSASRLFQKVF